LFESTNIKILTKEIIDFCSEIINVKRIILNINEMPEDLEILCHEIKISQILLNLINNGKDAILDSGVEEKWVNVEVTQLDKVLKISATDSGPGVPVELRTKIMESYFTTKEAGKGTGLGLALVQCFTQEHRGQFYLDENRERTCFVVEIPNNLTND
jgi:signal transduction histidine kinase